MDRGRPVSGAQTERGPSLSVRNEPLTCVGVAGLNRRPLRPEANLGSRSRSDGVERGASHQQKRPRGVCGGLRRIEPVGSPFGSRPGRERLPVSIKIDDDFMRLEIDGRTVATAQRRAGLVGSEPLAAVLRP